MKKCPLCTVHEDPEQRIVFENEYCLFIQKKSEQEVLEGSGLIIPKAHRENVFELSLEEWNATYDLLHRAKEFLDGQHSPDGYLLGWNVGKVSNQHLDHAHFHIIPRFNDEPHAGKGIRYWIKQPENKRRTEPNN
ncbi:HIT domain-containing protein [Paenibacillus aurantius]|uniref:HIT domain-containing protein n=1 Tax=Paenibacillus aurantius TaxID=2918900 RepID=A0AA96LMY4_9BACL|nr:HIT domain-containing protein [Paenibacillus aurantius]WNQ14117.1 HIT domain-containing protein [Paenibacillus aurantius]